jgi:hypothetical protein
MNKSARGTVTDEVNDLRYQLHRKGTSRERLRELDREAQDAARKDPRRMSGLESAAWMIPTMGLSALPTMKMQDRVYKVHLKEILKKELGSGNINKEAFLAGYMAKEAGCGSSHKKKKKKKTEKTAGIKDVKKGVTDITALLRDAIDTIKWNMSAQGRAANKQKDEVAKMFSKDAKKEMSKSDKKVKKVMGEYKRGELRSGSKTGPKVTSRDQAIAIALSEAGKSKK